MRIPSRGLSNWAQEIILACTASRPDRIQRGVAYRNLFLTGDEGGAPQTYLRTQDYVRDLASFIYSPADLRFAIDYYGQVSPAERAKANAAAAGLYQHVREGKVDTACSQATLWALIKGKTFLQMVWSRGGFEPYLIQPELFGVLREDLADLDRQEAFVHTTFLTRSRFAQMVSLLPSGEQRKLMDGVSRHAKDSREGEAWDQGNMLRQLMVSGLAPYQVQGTQSNQGGGIVNWLVASQPQLRADLVEKLIQLDELWVWDTERDDWATITMVGDMIVFGKDQRYNAFSQQYEVEDLENPLRGKHGFVEFCHAPIDGYFWGRSACADVALLQRSLNRRVDGINVRLRLEEDPARFITGSTSVNQNAYARLQKPGGYWTDSNPNAKIQDVSKEVPKDIWVSFHELDQMFDRIGGMPAVTRGEGEGSVRSQGHAETLLRTGSARHKDGALEVERSVEEIGGLALDMLKAKNNDILTAWVKPGVKSAEIDIDPDPSLEPPVAGMQAISFQFKHISDRAKVTVDAHSSSPSLRQEARELAFALNRIGAMSPERVIEATHPSNADTLIEDAERREIEHAQLVAQHPELAFPKSGGGGKRPH